MFIRQLEYFVTLAKVKHFAQAAEICCVTQPALSTAIRNLEEELGIPIVKRGRRYEGLTPEGELILQYANQVLVAWSGMKQVANLTKDTGGVRIGIIPTAMHVISLLSGAYAESNLTVRENVRMMNMEEINSALLRYEIDLGIGYANEALASELSFLPLFKEKFMLLAKKSSDIGKAGKPLSWEEVSKLPLALLSEDTENRRQMDLAFKRINVRPNIILETNSPVAIYSHVTISSGFSIVPQSWSMLTIMPSMEDVTLIDIEPSLENEVGLIALDKEPRSHIIDAIWEHAKSLREKGFLSSNTSKKGK